MGLIRGTTSRIQGPQRTLQREAACSISVPIFDLRINIKEKILKKERLYPNQKFGLISETTSRIQGRACSISVPIFDLRTQFKDKILEKERLYPNQKFGLICGTTTRLQGPQRTLQREAACPRSVPIFDLRTQVKGKILKKERLYANQKFGLISDTTSRLQGPQLDKRMFVKLQREAACSRSVPIFDPGTDVKEKILKKERLYPNQRLLKLAMIKF